MTKKELEGRLQIEQNIAKGIKKGIKQYEEEIARLKRIVSHDKYALEVTNKTIKHMKADLKQMKDGE